MVTVIIVNWNGGELLRQCLECLSHQTLPPDQILLVDNGSDDGSLEGLPQWPNLTIHLLGANLGFAGANNWALKNCQTKYVVLLNPDAFPAPDWLRRLVEAADGSPDVAAFGSCQMMQGRPGILDGIGDVYHASGLVWRQWFGRAFAASAERTEEIFSPCAAAALYRLDAVLETGGFDEEFFCYVEDVDLGFRLRLMGYRAICVPEAIVQHVGSAATGGQKSDFAVYHGHRNLVWTFVKDMPGVLFWLLLPLHLLLNIVSVVYFARRGQGRVIIRAKWDAFRGLPAVWRKRKIIQTTRNARVPDIWRLLDKRFMPRR